MNNRKHSRIRPSNARRSPQPPYRHSKTPSYIHNRSSSPSYRRPVSSSSYNHNRTPSLSYKNKKSKKKVAGSYKSTNTSVKKKIIIGSSLMAITLLGVFGWFSMLNIDDHDTNSGENNPVVPEDISVVGTLDYFKKWDEVTKAIITVDKMPTGTQNGDVVVLIVGGSGGKTNPPDPTGTWSLINKVVNGDIFIGAYYKVHRSNDPTSFKVGEANKFFVTLTTLRGVDTSNPVVDNAIDVDSSPLKYGAVAPSVSSVDGGVLLCGFAMDNPVHFEQGEIQNMKLLTSYGPGDDTMTTAIESTSGGTTGTRTAKKSNETGHCNEAEISISFRQ